jgi:hypothetical protein
MPCPISERCAISVIVPSLPIEMKTLGLRVGGAAAQALLTGSIRVPSTRAAPAAAEVLIKLRRLRFSMVNITMPPLPA